MRNNGGAQINFVLDISVVPRDTTSQVAHGYTLMMVSACTVSSHLRFLMHLVTKWTLQFYHMVEQMKSLTVDEKKWGDEKNVTTQFIEFIITKNASSLWRLKSRINLRQGFA